MATTECLNKYLGIGKENIDIYPRYSCCYRSASQRVPQLKVVYSTQITFYQCYYYNVEAEKAGSPNYYATITITNVISYTIMYS